MSSPIQTLMTRVAMGVMLFCIPGQTAYGDSGIDPNPPRYTLQALHERLATGAEGGQVGYSEPVTLPTNNVYTLQKIYGLTPSPAVLISAAKRSEVFDPARPGVWFWGLRAENGQWGGGQASGIAITVDPQSASLPAGYLASSVNLTQTVAQLKSVNLLTNVQVFGVQGSRVLLSGPPCPVAATAATTNNGVPWPANRFLVGTNVFDANCVLDRLTGLTWIQAPPAVSMVFTSAVAYCEHLDGLDGRGGYLDWRLPTLRELESLVAYDTLPSTPYIPHTNVFSFSEAYFWTSTRNASNTNTVWYLYPDGKTFVEYAEPDNPNHLLSVWPVRGPER